MYMNIEINDFGMGEESEDSLLRLIDRMLREPTKRKTREQREKEAADREAEQQHKLEEQRKVLARMLLSPTVCLDRLWFKLKELGENNLIAGTGVPAVHLLATPDSILLPSGRRKDTNARERQALEQNLEVLTGLAIDFWALDLDGYTPAEAAMKHGITDQAFHLAWYMSSQQRVQRPALGKVLQALLLTWDYSKEGETSTHWQHAASALTDLGEDLDATHELMILNCQTPREWALARLPKGSPLKLILSKPESE